MQRDQAVEKRTQVREKMVLRVSLSTLEKGAEGQHRRIHAVKIISKDGTSQETQEEAVNEALMVMDLHHKHIVRY